MAEARIVRDSEGDVFGPENSVASLLADDSDKKLSKTIMYCTMFRKLGDVQPAYSLTILTIGQIRSK